MLVGTAHAWLEAITNGREFEAGRDTPRIRAAFGTLAQTRELWPAPKHFLDALPRVEQRAIGYEIKPLSREEANKRMADIRSMLGEPVPTFKPEPLAERTGPSKAEVEQELRQHYGKDAAAGPDA